MSADAFTRWNSYFYSGTDVLINKPGLREPAALKEFEYGMAISRAAELPASGIKGNFDLAHLQAIHRHLFQDTYEWAGQIRDVSMAKGKSVTFEKPENIPAAAEKIHARLAASDYLKGLQKKDFVQNVATFYADMNRLHPFREGNGRSTRVLIGELAERAGYVLDQTRIENGKGQWNEAAAQSMGGDTSAVEKILSEAIRPSRSVAFENLPRDQALAKHPELKPLFAALDATAKDLEAKHPGNAKAQTHFLTHKRTEMVRQLDTGDTKGLDMPGPVKAPAGRFDAHLQKAQAFAEASIPDPAARAAFMARFQEKVQAVERAGAGPTAPAKKTDIEIGR